MIPVEDLRKWADEHAIGHGLSYYGELLGCIEDASTIIPAEEGET